jgi:putative ABC transport system permease protein
MLKDLKFSMRSLVSQPGFAAVAIITLALGIGANTAIFSILDSVLLEDLPYEDPDRLYMLRSQTSTGAPGLMAPRFADPLYEGHPSVEAAAIAWALAGSVVDRSGTPFPFTPYRVTSRFFDVFNGEIALGRGFEPNEPATSIVLSNAAWRDYFGSDPGIIDGTIVVDGSERIVVGVARDRFVFPNGAGSWQPFSTEGGGIDDLINFEAYLRLRPGVPAERFEGELRTLSEALGPNTETGEHLTYVLNPLLDEVIGDLGSTILILSGATAVLLLIACLNVASILFARANARAHEIGLREALGAGRWRIVRQLLTESLLISTAGGVLGVALAFAGVRILLGLGPADLPRLGDVAIDPSVLVFSAAAVLVTTVLVGLAPAIRLSGTQVRTLISKGGRGGSAGRRENRIFGGLVIAEVGLAVVLVIGAGLLIQSYVNLSATDPGFEHDRILIVRMNPTSVPIDLQGRQLPDGTIEITGSGYQPIIDFYHQLADRLRGIAGVADVATAQVLPLYPNPVQASPEPFTIFGQPDTGNADRQVIIRSFSASFLPMVGARVLEGRGLEPNDRRGTPGVALVNETFVRQYLPDGNPVGQRLGLPSGDFEPGIGRGYGFAERIYDEVEIVGVVADIRYTRLSEAPPPIVYMSSDQFTTRARLLAIQTEIDDPASLIPTIRREVAAMAPEVPVEFGVYSEAVDASIARERLGMALLGTFGAIALVLAAVGIYGMMAYSANQRTREMALRVAVGASASEVRGLVMKRGLTLAAIGIGLGLAASLALGRFVSSQLYEVSPMEPRLLVLVPVLLVGVALIASFVPARRASKVDPGIMLRME